MISVSRDIISKSVAPNKAMDMMRRDSDDDNNYLPRHRQKRQKKRKNNDIFSQISEDDLNRDSDEEAQEALKNHARNANNSSNNQSNHNDSLNITQPDNFNKQQVPASAAPKSALSAMMALVDPNEFDKRNSTAKIGSNFTRNSMANGQTQLTRNHSNDVYRRGGSKRSTIHKRDTIHRRGNNGNGQNTEQYYDSSDSDEMRIMQSQHGNPLDNNNISTQQSNGQMNMNTVLVYIEEFKNDQPYRVSTHKNQHSNLPKTVNDIIIEVYTKCVDNNRILKGASVGDYVLREWDDDEPGDVTMDGGAKINELYCDAVCICYAGQGRGTVNINKIAHQLSNDIGGGKKGGPRKNSAVTVEYLNKKYENVFVRVQVPGPMNDTFTLKIDNESAALNVRDLCMSLNKKKNQIYFNPQYFDFYYQGLTSNGLEGPINKQIKVLDLKKKDLVILPKIIKPDDSIEEKERAFAFPLVKLANEVSKFKAYKVKNSQKKARILSVDRYRIVKQSLEDEKFKIMRRNEKVPIDITAITSIKINNDNNAQFILHYNHPNGGNRKHVYEMSSKQECAHCVSKIKYLVTLRKLQG